MIRHFNDPGRKSRIAQDVVIGSHNGREVFICFEHPSHDGLDEDGHRAAFRFHVSMAREAQEKQRQMEEDAMALFPAEKEKFIAALYPSMDIQREIEYHVEHANLHGYAADEAKKGIRVPPDACFSGHMHKMHMHHMELIPSPLSLEANDFLHRYFNSPWISAGDECK